MAPHSSTLAWKIPWMEKPGRLQSMGSRKVRHDWATSLSLFTFMHWRRKWQPIVNPLPTHCLENPRGGGPWWAAVSGVAQSRTRLKRLSSSSSSSNSSKSCYSADSNWMSYWPSEYSNLTLREAENFIHQVSPIVVFWLIRILMYEPQLNHKT